MNFVEQITTRMVEKFVRDMVVYDDLEVSIIVPFEYFKQNPHVATYDSEADDVHLNRAYVENTLKQSIYEYIMLDDYVENKYNEYINEYMPLLTIEDATIICNEERINIKNKTQDEIFNEADNAILSNMPPIKDVIAKLVDAYYSERGEDMIAIIEEDAYDYFVNR